MSIVMAYSPAYAWDLIDPVVNWVLLYYLVTRVVTSEARMLLFASAFFLWSFKMSQFGARAFIMNGFRFRSWGTGGGPAWFQNSGEFAIQMCILLAMTLQLGLALRDRWPKWKAALVFVLLPGTAALAIIMSSSRGGQLAAAGAILLLIAQGRHRVRGLVLVALLLPTLWTVVPAEQKARFSSMGEDDTSQSRLTYWRDGLKIIQDNPVLGVGYGNWLPYYQTFYNRAGQVPHNIFIEAGAELGYAGLGAFVLLIVGTFVANARTRRASKSLPQWGPFYRGMAYGLDGALVSYLIAGFFVTVLYYPFFWVNLTFSSALLLTVRRRAETSRRPPGPHRRRRAAGAIQPAVHAS
jgi:O-antigen ligase